jgi:hypothetical protein
VDVRIDNKGCDSIYTTNSRNKGQDITGPAIKLPEEIPEKDGEVISPFVDLLDWISDRIKKKIEWFRKWLDEMDRHIIVLPNPGCS